MPRPLMSREAAELVRKNSPVDGPNYWLARSYLALLDGLDAIPTKDDGEFDRAIASNVA